MPASAFDSAIYRDLLGDAEVAKLFTDTADVRAMLLVEGALAKAQAGCGLIPEASAQAIHRAAMEVQIDPAALAEETGQSAVVVPALVRAFREAMQAPEHAQYVHWGATSQDIIDTGLVLRLRQVMAIFEACLTDTLTSLANLAEANADLPMAGRTFGQAATPTSFGAVVAAWGAPLLGARSRLPPVRDAVLHVALSGAAGTLSAMGDHGPSVRAALADALGLRDPGLSWHTNRDALASLAAWMTQTTAALAKIGEDLTLMAQSGIGEVSLGTAGGSSTMPQKQNPIQPAVLAALARLVNALNSTMQAAVVHRQQRDGSAWISEWLTIPQMCIATAKSLSVASSLLPAISPNANAMARNIDRDGVGAIYAEALSFALTRLMPRPDAQAAVKDLCTAATKSGRSLRALASERWPDTDLSAVFYAQNQLGTAASEARNFARIARRGPND